jgi:crotonobetainyl-CoA:carnitine CoA-transferase CaiB-like acyl-CoA transferase
MTQADTTYVLAPLQGVTVLEWGSRIGAAVAGSLLAQLGATVICAESRSNGNFEQPKWRFRQPLAAGKWCVAVSADNPEDRKLIERLSTASDIVIVCSDADPLAYDFRTLSLGQPKGVYCDLTAFGDSGPHAGRAATDAQIQALSGMMDATGMPDAAPMAVALPLIEHLAGIHAAGAILAALRRSSAGPQQVEVSLYDAAFSAMTTFLPAALGGVRKTANRVGNRHPLSSPWNVYRANDGWVLVCAGNDEQWQRICKLMGPAGEQLAAQFPAIADRVSQADRVDAGMQSWIGQHTIATCIREFASAGIPCGPIAPVDGFPREANLEYRSMIREASAPDGHPCFVAGSPLRMSRSSGIAPTSISAPDADRKQVHAWLDAQAPSGRPSAAQTSSRDRPLAGIRVLEIGHYTTAPAASRQLAALGAEVIKLEPPDGEAVRHWPPMKGDRAVFFSFQNADKRSLVLDIADPSDLERLKAVIASCDVLIENLRPGALARKGLTPEALNRLNPRLVACSISGFGLDSIYQGRPAFDTVVQAMSGLMDLNRAAGVPMKTGPSMADVMGAAFAATAILAALEERQRSGLGQFIDLSMQDICAWSTQIAWNGHGLDAPPEVVQSAHGYGLGCDDAGVPVMAILDVVHAEQTLARQLWQPARAEDGSEQTVIRCPARFALSPETIPVPARALGLDTADILRELGLI